MLYLRSVDRSFFMGVYRGRPNMGPGPLRQLVQSGLIKPQRQLGKGTKRPPEGSLKVGSRAGGGRRGERCSLGYEPVHVGRGLGRLLNPINFTFSSPFVSATAQALRPTPAPLSLHFPSAIHPLHWPPDQSMLCPLLKALSWLFIASPTVGLFFFLNHRSS